MARDLFFFLSYFSDKSGYFQLYLGKGIGLRYHGIRDEIFVLKFHSLDRIIGKKSDMLIDDLKAIQELHGYLPEKELRELSAKTRTPLYEIQGVASFYPHFHLEPPLPVRVEVCADLACHPARGRRAQGSDSERYSGRGSGQSAREHGLLYRTMRPAMRDIRE